MKEIFTFDFLFRNFITSVGYGFGYIIPSYLGAGSIVSLVCCFAVGFLFELVADVILKDEFSKKHRVILGLAIYAAYLVFWAISYNKFGHDLDDDLFGGIMYVVIFQAIGFVINVVKNFFVIKKKENNEKDI